MSSDLAVQRGLPTQAQIWKAQWQWQNPHEPMGLSGHKAPQIGNCDHEGFGEQYGGETFAKVKQDRLSRAPTPAEDSSHMPSDPDFSHRQRLSRINVQEWCLSG